MAVDVNYEQRYYDSLTDSAKQSAKEIVPLVLALLSPASVVDVGCGAGGWLAEFQNHGIAEILGIDGPWVATNQLQIPADRFRVADLGQPFQESRRFDLAVCLEVAEHVHASQADTLIGSLTGLSEAVLFSAAIPCQGGENHFNEQWPDYWVPKFEQRGYVVIDCLRQDLWTNPKVEYWYAQNMMLFVTKAYLDGHERLRTASEQTRRQQLSIVHPRAFLEGSVRAKRPRDLVQATLGSIKRALLSRSAK